MEEIPVRELRNNVSQILRRVEDGERLRITVSGRAVAEIVPLTDRPVDMSWPRFAAELSKVQADEGLRDELLALVPDRTDQELA